MAARQHNFLREQAQAKNNPEPLIAAQHLPRINTELTGLISWTVRHEGSMTPDHKHDAWQSLRRYAAERAFPARIVQLTSTIVPSGVNPRFVGIAAAWTDGEILEFRFFEANEKGLSWGKKNTASFTDSSNVTWFVHKPREAKPILFMSQVSARSKSYPYA